MEFVFSIGFWIDILIYLTIPFGLWISFRILRYPDLAIEQVFVLGGVLASVVISNNWHVIYIVPLIITFSFFIAYKSSFFRYRLKVNPVILSLIMYYGYYSLSLVLMGKPNLSIYQFFTRLSNLDLLLLISTFWIFVAAISFYFFKTKNGIRVVATGCNSGLIDKLGFRPFIYGGLGLALSYFIILSGGAFYSIRLMNADISYGSGFLLMGIFVVLFTRVFDKRVSVLRNLFFIFIVTILYSVVLQYIISLNFPSELTRGFYAAMLLFLVVVSPKKDFHYF